MKDTSTTPVAKRNARQEASQSTVADTIKKYELMVIFNPDLGEDASKKLLEEVRKLITERKGEIFFEDIWGMRDLAYPIKKHRKGYYAVFDFNLPAQFVREINNKLVLERDLLRHMIISLPFGYEPKSFAVISEEKPQIKDEKAVISVPKAAATPSKPVKAKEEEKAKEETEAKAKADEGTKKVAKKKETTLEDVDAKLKSIIDNPDINF